MLAQAIRVLGFAPHPGGPFSPDDLWTAWRFEPSVLIPIVLSILIYGWGLYKLWAQAGAGRGIMARHWVSFLGAILALLVGLVSPLDALSEALFSAHMVQHLILMLVVAPLLVVSEFPRAFLWAIPRRQAHALGHGVHQGPVSRIWQGLSHPIVVWCLFTIVLWLWHAPVLFEAALRNQTIHTLEHICLLATAMFFWWVLFRHSGPDHIRFGVAIPYLFLTVLQSGIFGALMTFTSQPWYPDYAATVTAWGLTTLQDQQLAGLIMWVPGGAVFTLLTIGYFAVWLRAMEHHSLRLDQRASLRESREIKE